ncbi:hypothetical protein Tco_0001873 [Tanacetum coccineum]
MLHAMAPLWFLRTSRSLVFSVADNAKEITTDAKEITTVSWLFSWRKAYSRCSGISFSSSLYGSIFEGFNQFFGAFNSSGSTGSSLRQKETSCISFGPSSSSASIPFPSWLIVSTYFSRTSFESIFTTKCPMRHGSVKLPGSPSFWGKLLWITVEHSSLSLTEEVAFSSFFLCERRSFKTLAPFGMWIMASRNGGKRKIDRDSLTMLVKHFSYSLRVEFPFEHEVRKLILKLDSDDPLRTTFSFLQEIHQLLLQEI